MVIFENIGRFKKAKVNTCQFNFLLADSLEPLACLTAFVGLCRVLGLILIQPKSGGRGQEGVRVSDGS